MSYTTLGYLCENVNGAPFSGSAPVPVGASASDKKVVLLGNYGGAGYSNPVVESALRNGQYQCDGRSTFKSAYSVQMNPYGASMCMNDSRQ
jgi:hypothetical protein